MDLDLLRPLRTLLKVVSIIIAALVVQGCISFSGGEVGEASWYGKKYHGRKTASGERFNMYQLTGAHKELPFGTRVKVVNLENDRSVVIKINDRGPFIPGRIIDLSYNAAKKIGMIKKGVAKVEVIPLP